MSFSRVLNLILICNKLTHMDVRNSGIAGAYIFHSARHRSQILRIPLKIMKELIQYK